MNTITGSIAICFLAFWALAWLVRRGDSLGLPVAYLFSLLLIHVPGAIAHTFQTTTGSDGPLTETLYTEIGIRLAAIASVCFVIGAWFARQSRVREAVERPANRFVFWRFCVAAGWFLTYALSFLGNVPSLGAAIEKGGAVWMLGVLLGLREAIRRGSLVRAFLWLVVLLVYPVLMLLVGGFLSYGSAAIIIVLSVLVVSVSSPLRVSAGIVIAAIISFNLFLSYFKHRDEIRDAVWGRAPIEQRVDAAMNMFRDFSWFDPTDERQLFSLDTRLNQNYFVGLAMTRIAAGDVDYLYGRSLVESAMSIVPRFAWPDKPVFAGSPRIIADMTGLNLSETTSWGVGNVMEFEINFGTTGMVIGFLLLGWAIAWLDRRAFLAEESGDLGNVFVFFLPCLALIQPNGSLIELTGGAAAAFVAGLFWRWTWNFRARQIITQETTEPVTI